MNNDSKLSPTAVHELLLQDKAQKPDFQTFGEPTNIKRYSWREWLAFAWCLVAFVTAASVVFVPRWAVYWGQDGQFIWVGFCLTVMAWCAQLPLKRLFLTLAARSNASTLQTLDAVLRSDPLAENADWSFKLLLVSMLALGPGLSIAYKDLGGGESRFQGATVVVPVGLTGPPGTQNIGYGLSQFVNATLPWFEDPGFDRVYGFNTYVADENTTVMLDGPMPSYLKDLQASLRPRQTKYISGDVAALECSLNNDLNSTREDLDQFFNSSIEKTDQLTAMQQWIWNTDLYVGMLFPEKNNNSNIYFSAWNTLNNETFGTNARHYDIKRQLYTGNWHVTPTTVKLDFASSKNKRLDDHGVFTTVRVSLNELFLNGMIEYDSRFRSFGSSGFLKDSASYNLEIKTDATPLASMVWARFVAWMGPETWDPTKASPTDEMKKVLLYNSTMLEETAAVTIEPGWKIALVLLINPLVMLGSLLCRVLLWPRSPIGEGFGVITLLSSIETRSLALLDGAGLSGKLARPLHVRFRARAVPGGTPGPAMQKISTVLETETMRSEDLQRGILYR
jgi:hypothetical protein